MRKLAEKEDVFEETIRNSVRDLCYKSYFNPFLTAGRWQGHWHALIMKSRVLLCSYAQLMEALSVKAGLF